MTGPRLRNIAMGDTVILFTGEFVIFQGFTTRPGTCVVLNIGEDQEAREINIADISHKDG